MHPEVLTPFALILCILIVALVDKGILRRSSAGKRFNQRNDLPFNPTDASFLSLLEQVIGENYCVIDKVRIADILRPQEGSSQSACTSALNRITSKHLDFAVCDPRTMQVVGVIEMDDLSNQETSRRRRDKLVDAALSSAGIPLVRIPSQPEYKLAEIRKRISVLFASANPSSWRIQSRMMFCGSRPMRGLCGNVRGGGVFDKFLSR